MSKQISAVLPDDVAEMLQGEQKGRSVNVTIVEALRAYWTRRLAKEAEGFERDIYLHGLAGEKQPEYPVFGSIPADRKSDAGA